MAHVIVIGKAVLLCERIVPEPLALICRYTVLSPLVSFGRFFPSASFSFSTSFLYPFILLLLSSSSFSSFLLSYSPPPSNLFKTKEAL